MNHREESCMDGGPTYKNAQGSPHLVLVGVDIAPLTKPCVCVDIVLVAEPLVHMAFVGVAFVHIAFVGMAFVCYVEVLPV